MLTAPEQAQSGQPLALTAVLWDRQGNPAGGATVRFFVKVDFFTTGQMEIGDAVTNEQGIAVFEYSPRLTGNTQMVARYEAIEAVTTISLGESAEPFYEAEAGLHLIAPGDEVFIGPKRLEPTVPGEEKSPMTGFRLPGSILSWLLLLVGCVMLVWFTYARAFYQVFHISMEGQTTDINIKLVPRVGITIAILVGIMLVLILVTGPHSHFHIVP